MITKRNYNLLGILFSITKPEEAHAILSAYIPRPIETNLGMVPVYYLHFCSINQIPASRCRGKLYKSSMVEMRKLFISSMVHIYCPEVYEQNQKKLRMPIGFVNAICNELRTDPSAVSRTIREVVAEEKIYEEFKAKAGEITAELIKVISAG